MSRASQHPDDPSPFGTRPPFPPDSLPPSIASSTATELGHSGPRRGLSLADAVSIIVGTIIGAAIFHTPQWVAGQVDSSWAFLGVWLLGGAIACCGALCFAELTTAYNETGGDYVYLRQSFGRGSAFLFAWTTGWIIRPANVAAMAITFALFAQNLSVLVPESWQQNLPAPWRPGLPGIAMLGVIALAGLNFLGFAAGKWTQNVLTISKVGGLLILCLVGSMVLWQPVAELNDPTSPPTIPVTEPALSGADQAAPTAESSEDEAPAPRHWTVILSALLMAMVFVLYTFGGWNDIAFVAGEIQQPNRNLPRALFIGIAVVTAVYLLVNLVLLANLGLDGLAATKNAPAAVVTQRLAPWGWDVAGGVLFSVLVSVSCLGAINAMLITSPRIYYAAGRQHRLFQWFGHWDQVGQVPRRAILAQVLATIGLLAVCSGWFGPMWEWLRGGAPDFKDYNPFDELVAVSSPFFWGFLTMVIVGHWRLRITDPERPRPVRTWGFPLPNLIFGGTSIFMIYSSSRYAWEQGYLVSGSLVLTIFALGCVLAATSRPPTTSH